MLWSFFEQNHSCLPAVTHKMKACRSKRLQLYGEIKILHQAILKYTRKQQGEEPLSAEEMVELHSRRRQKISVDMEKKARHRYYDMRTLDAEETFLVEIPQDATCGTAPKFEIVDTGSASEVRAQQKMLRLRVSDHEKEFPVERGMVLENGRTIVSWQVFLCCAMHVCYLFVGVVW